MTDKNWSDCWDASAKKHDSSHLRATVFLSSNCSKQPKVPKKANLFFPFWPSGCSMASYFCCAKQQWRSCFESLLRVLLCPIECMKCMACVCLLPPFWLLLKHHDSPFLTLFKGPLWNVWPRVAIFSNVFRSDPFCLYRARGCTCTQASNCVKLHIILLMISLYFSESWCQWQRRGRRRLLAWINISKKLASVENSQIKICEFSKRGFEG